jgi:hypothetical protein
MSRDSGINHKDTEGLRLDLQHYRCRAAVGEVVEGNHRRVLGQNRSDDLPLHADTAAMDDAHFPKPALDGLIQVLFNDDLDFSRLKRMQVDEVFNRILVHSIQYNHALRGGTDRSPVKEAAKRCTYGRPAGGPDV